MTDEPPATDLANAYDLFITKLGIIHPDMPDSFKKILKTTFYLGAFETLGEILTDDSTGVNPDRAGQATYEAIAGPDETRDAGGPIARGFATLLAGFGTDPPPLAESTYYHGAYSALKLVSNSQATEISVARLMKVIAELLAWRRTAEDDLAPLIKPR